MRQPIVPTIHLSCKLIWIIPGWWGEHVLEEAGWRLSKPFSVSRNDPSWEKDNLEIPFGILNVCSTAPVPESQSLAVVSPDVATMSLPAGENTKAATGLEYPASACSATPVDKSQSLIVLSFDAEATSLPFGENTTAMTQSECPLRICSVAPVDESQILIVSSPEADAMSLPSGENTTALTKLECPCKVCSAAPVDESQILTVLSQDADAMSLPSSGENTTASTILECPSSAYNAGLQYYCSFATAVTQLCIWPLNSFRIKLISGANNNAELYICRGAFSMIYRKLRENRFASWINAYKEGLWSTFVKVSWNNILCLVFYSP